MLKIAPGFQVSIKQSFQNIPKKGLSPYLSLEFTIYTVYSAKQKKDDPETW